jgi:hypothetical protein
MSTVTSFHVSDVRAEDINAITMDYLALECTRTFRRLLVTRFALLALLFAIISSVWLSPVALWFSVGLCVVVPALVWTVELRQERRLARRLDAISEHGSPSSPSAFRS